MSTESTLSDLGICEHLANGLGKSGRDLLSRFPLLAHDVQAMFDLGVSHGIMGRVYDADKAILQQVAAGNLLSGQLLGRKIPDACKGVWAGRSWNATMIGSFLRFAYREGVLHDMPLQ